MVKCPRCKGTGKIAPYPLLRGNPKSKKIQPTDKTSDQCHTCGGRGSLPERSKLKYDIGQAEAAMTPFEIKRALLPEDQVKALKSPLNTAEKALRKLYADLNSGDAPAAATVEGGQ